MLEKLIKQEEKKWEQRVHLNSRHFDATSNDKNSNNNWNDENKNKFSFIIHKMFGQKKRSVAFLCTALKKTKRKLTSKIAHTKEEKKCARGWWSQNHKTERIHAMKWCIFTFIRCCLYRSVILDVEYEFYSFFLYFFWLLLYYRYSYSYG